MPSKKPIDPATIESISNDIFALMPLLRMRLLHMAHLQDGDGVPLPYMQVLSLLGETGTISMSIISYRLGIAKPNLAQLDLTYTVSVMSEPISVYCSSH